jgi:hypothetical protein
MQWFPEQESQATNKHLKTRRKHVDTQACGQTFCASTNSATNSVND